MKPRRALLALCLAAGCSTDPTVEPIDGMDAAVGVDVATTADVLRVPTGDGGTVSLLGSWRVVGYELGGGADGGVDGGAAPTRYTDREMPVRDPATGATVGARVNGLLEVSATTVRLAFGVLRDGRFSVTAPGVTAVSTYDGSGFFVDEGRFVGGSGMASFRFASAGDGTLLVTVEGGDARRLLLQPEIDAAPATSAEVTLRVRALPGPRPMAIANARSAIFWELPGRGTLVEDRGAPVAVTTMDLDRTLPLQPLRVPGVDGTPAFALGHPALYDDVNGNGVFDAATDAIRSVTQLALGWRDPGSDAGTDAVAARLRPGWQVVALHRRSLDATLVPLRMDRATPVPLECVATDAPAGALPDALR